MESVGGMNGFDLYDIILIIRMTLVYMNVCARQHGNSDVRRKLEIGDVIAA